MRQMWVERDGTVELGVEKEEASGSNWKRWAMQSSGCGGEGGRSF